jgi:hypothetical protein
MKQDPTTGTYTSSTATGTIVYPSSTTTYPQTVTLTGWEPPKEPDYSDWAGLFYDNYYGRTPQAQSLEPFLKQTFKGNAYLPWAVMERLTYMQDPKATFIKVKNKQGGLVHSDILPIESLVRGEESKVQACAHFVEVELIFMGKKFVENYPIQDTAYGAPKMFDQNQVNKALQRALAKVASRATGLGLSLYESGDLNFDDTVGVQPITRPEPAKKPVTEKVEEMLEQIKEPEPVKKVTRSASTKKSEPTPEPTPEPVVEPVVEPEPVAVTVDEPLGDSDIDKIIAILKNPDLKVKVTNALRSFNPSFIKNYGMTINTTDLVQDLRTKLAKLSDVDKFLRAIERVTQ